MLLYCYIIRIDPLMKKKASLKKTFKELVKAEENHMSTSSLKRYKVELPKLTASNFKAPLPQKTLSSAIKSLEQYIQQMGSKLNSKVIECLAVLKDQINPNDNPYTINIRMTESCINRNSLSKQNFPQQSNIIAMSKSHVLSKCKSQVFNVSRSQLQKVQSKQLFEKATTAKHLRGDLAHIKREEIINVLKSKIEDRDNTIRKLHNHFDEVKLELNQFKSKAQVLGRKSQDSEEENTMLERVNRELKEKNAEMGYSLRKYEEQMNTVEQKLKSIEQRNITLKEQCEIFKAKLSEREDEITALYGAYQTFMN